MTERMQRGIGDNRQELPRVRVSVKMFNSLAAYGGGCAPVDIELDAGATVAEIVHRFGVPFERIFLVLVNGRDISRSLDGAVNLARELEDGDAVTLSGPVPYSWGYGAPVI
jgi:hypothetical protein